MMQYTHFITKKYIIYLDKKHVINELQETNALIDSLKNNPPKKPVKYLGFVHQKTLPGNGRIRYR
jgi:hypothetical protein